MVRRLLLVLMMVLGVHLWDTPAAEAAGNDTMVAMWGVTPDRPWSGATTDADCGGQGQVACINPDLTYAGPYEGCNTNRLINILNFCNKCGGAGDLTCKFGPKCDAGSREIAGICTYSGYSSEPTPNVSVTPTLTQPATGPVRGIVDLHAHQFSNLGFGGVVFWGAPYDAGGINEALPWCDYTWKFSTTMATTGAAGPTVPFLGHEVHGAPAVQWAANPIGVVMGEGLHDPAGTGSFAGWPTYKTVTHQQMYYTWVERAFLGGVRMMVQLAVTNEALCGMGKVRDGFTCDDMDAVDKQIQATKDLEKAIDQKDDGKVNGSGWYRIAYSPAEARAHIRAGKMAVVLGIEVDSLFGCKPGVVCSEKFLREQLQQYYDLGVRHVFPIHQYDNAFGGAAIFRGELNAANRVVAGRHFRVRDCSAEGYTYNVTRNIAIDFLSLLLQGAEFPDQSYYDQFPADCNADGLTATGETLINAMMDMGFIIDVDHMSRLMLDDTLAIAQARDYPLVSGHSTLRGSQGGHEFSLTDAQMAAIRDLGGMVSAINSKGDCGTSEGFPYHYKHAVAGMQRKPGDRFAAVGFSTDMNGFGGSTGPRFGNPDCPGTPNTELSYPFKGILGGAFDKQRTGDRTFDFNYQGVAHYGLLADYFADIRKNFLTAEEFEPLLNSAESYIRMWTRASPGDAKPSVRPVVTGTRDAVGFAYVSDVRVRWEVTGGAGYDVSLSGCAEQVITQDTTLNGVTFTCTAEAFYEDTDEDRVVVASEEKSITIWRDTTPPTVTWGSAPFTLTPGWYNKDVEYPFTVTDATTGVDGRATGKVEFLGEGAGLTETVTVSDRAGNSATYTSPAVNIDKTLPEVVFVGQSSDANAAGWHRENLTLTWSCADALSGPVVDQMQRSLTVDGEGLTATGRCTDRAGNEATDRRTGFNLDKTPPTVAWTMPTPNAAGWHNTDVSVVFAAEDAMSGVASTSPSSPLVLITEGDAVTGTVTVTDVAGNSATLTSPSVRIDKTAPEIAFVSHAPAVNAAGWNRHDPTVTWACSDGLSGTVDAQVTRTLTTEGAGQALSAQCADLAGNVVSNTRTGLNLDKSLPTLVWTPAAPSANAAGWRNADVVFAFAADDGVSGVASTSPSSPLVLSTEGAAVSGTVTVTDVAGNSATFASPVVKIDKTAPTLAWAAAAPVANAAGWHNTDVTLAFTADDAVSGVAETSLPSPVVLAAEGANITGTVTVTDVAGNTATFTSPVVRIDKTAPIVTCVADPAVLWPPNGRMMPVTVDLQLSDAVSGGVTYVMTAAASNEPGAATDIAGFTVGGQAVTGALRAQRDGRGTGRVYTLGYQGTDSAGNTASCTTVVTVPRSQGRGGGRSQPERY